MSAFLKSLVIFAAIASVVVALAITEPTSTVSASSNAKSRGAEVFATHGCAHCHGPAGVGGNEGPDLQLVRKRLDKTQITKQIHDGGKSMPAFADTLSSTQIDDLVTYLRAKRKIIVVAPKRPAAMPTPAQSDPD